MIKAVQFVTLLVFSLVTGVFWGTWFSLSRSMAAITPGTFLEVGRLMITNLGGPMSVLMRRFCPLSCSACCYFAVDNPGPIFSRVRHWS
ncbi:MAG TPA: hypothetical protein VHI98_05540 [Vicinamibacterales bacterium]|nr:hypothetical protein [Vicinamibacterales bacterium]